MRGITTVITIVAALLCLAPAAYCSGVDEGAASPPVGAPGNAAGVLLAFTPAPARAHRAEPAPPARAFTHSFTFLFTGCSGTASNETTFSSGRSRLDWPMEFNLVGGQYRARFRDIVEWDIAINACPWMKSRNDMEDYDWLEESHWQYPSHDGVDIYSESTTDSKAFILDTTLRAFPLRYRYGSIGLLLGYQEQEMDYKTYDLQQTGYGPWAVYSTSLTGPASTYNLTYDILSLGLAWRLKAGEQASLTLDTALIPWARAKDEDEHLLRYRQSKTDCDGSGYMLSMNGQLSLTRKWFVSTSCSRIHISADGDQKQYWWGNDPGSAGDETGVSVRGIDADMDQDSFRISLGLGCAL